MIISILEKGLFDLLVKQIRFFFLLSKEEELELAFNFNIVLEKVEKNFSFSSNKYYHKEVINRKDEFGDINIENNHTEVYFNPFHSAQYTIFLYYYSNIIGKSNLLLADKIYYLNKTMNSCDLFHQVNLPDIFFTDHPVGSVMGRAQYSNFFSFTQNCTVGNNNGIYPKIGNNVRMCVNSMILGNCSIGDNVIIGAKACVKDEDIPENTLVFGSSPNLILKNRK